MSDLAVEPIKLIICIVDRGKSNAVTELCAKENLPFHIQLNGRGTADSQTLALLALGEREKAIMLISTVQSRNAEILEKLTKKLNLNEPGGGIAFSIPFSSVAAQADSLAFFSGMHTHLAQEAQK